MPVFYVSQIKYLIFWANISSSVFIRWKMMIKKNLKEVKIVIYILYLLVKCISAEKETLLFKSIGTYII